MSSILTRRDAIAAFASTAAVTLLTGCSEKSSSAPPPIAANTNAEADALKLLGDIAEDFAHAYPELATSLGVDTGSRAALRSQFSDRSAEGQQRIAAMVRKNLKRAKAIDTSSLTHATRTSVEVVRSAY